MDVVRFGDIAAHDRVHLTALLLARMTDREHEIAVRYSLGASRRSLIAQLLTETFVLSASWLGRWSVAGRRRREVVP